MADGAISFIWYVLCHTVRIHASKHSFICVSTTANEKRLTQELSSTWFITRKWGMAGLGLCSSSHPKRAMLLEESFSLDITRWSESTGKVSENACCGLCKPLSPRSRAPSLGHYVALAPRRVRVSPNTTRISSQGRLGTPQGQEVCNYMGSCVRRAKPPWSTMLVKHQRSRCP